MDITQEHAEYINSKAAWQEYSDLYAGGERLKERAHLYLDRRQKEPLDVYSERLSRAFYENYIGSIIDWYAATLFRREPMLTFNSSREADHRFYTSFVDDCDLRSNTFTAVLRKQFLTALIYGKSYLLVDFPHAAKRPRTKGEEDARGLSRAYLVDYEPRDVINWSKDHKGRYDWVVIRQEAPCRSMTIDHEVTSDVRWLYFDRTQYRVYEKPSGTPVDAKPMLIDQGLHGLASQQIVPLFELRLTDGMWLMNKSAQLQLEHFNKSNALSWALTLGLFAMPVVYTDKEWKQIIGESYYIQLGPNDRFGWTEPEGKVFQIAADNLARLKEEIYRVCYLLHQARPVSGSAISQSGLSKQQDLYVTHEILRAFGDLVKDYSLRVLRSISVARHDDACIGVEGLDQFDVGDFSTEISDAERLLGLGISSSTLTAQIYKKLAAKYLCDVRQEVKSVINSEIDEATDIKKGYIECPK